MGIVNSDSKTLVTIKDSNISKNAGFIEASEDAYTLSILSGNLISDNTPEAYKEGR